MPAIRVNRLLPGVVAALALLFAVLEPPASRGLSFPAALAFWLLHIGIGTLLAVRATEWLSRGAAAARWSPWLRLLAGGVAGSLLFAPVALAIDALLPLAATVEPPDDVLDQWEAAGGALAVLAEWLQLSPSYLASWLLINAVPLAAAPSFQPDPPLRRAATPPAQDAANDASSHGTTGDTDSTSAPAIETPPAEPTATAEPDAPASDPATAAREAFLSQLPPAIGHELIAIQADLHYLQVRTARGRATVLASIATAEAALGGIGLRVHRSYWVALAHVVRISRGARGTTLTLSDGSRVPVSRRRVAEVQARLGRDFVVDPA